MRLGQGTLEYLGIVVVVVLLVGALITAFTAFNLGTKITDAAQQDHPWRLIGTERERSDGPTPRRGPSLLRRPPVVADASAPAGVDLYAGTTTTRKRDT